MDINDNTFNEDVDKTNRTLWVGNLHPKVTTRNIAELFYQVGPVEYVEFSFDEYDICDNFAWVVFKYPSSVEDSLKLFHGTKLYGLPIVTKACSKHLEDPVFDDQLNYFKQLVNVEYSRQTNDSNTSRWNDQSSNNLKYFPDSLPDPPINHAHHVNTDQDNYNNRPKYKDKYSRHQNINPYVNSRNMVERSLHNPIGKFHHSRGYYRKSQQDNSSGSMEVPIKDQNSHLNQNYNRRHRDYDVPSSSNWKESTYHNQEPPSFVNENRSAKDRLPGHDLRVTLYRRHSVMDPKFRNDPNNSEASTSMLDHRDSMYHSRNSKNYGDTGRNNESDSNNRWSKRNHNNSFGSSDQERHTNNQSSEHYTELNTKYQSQYNDREYFNRSFNQDKSHNNFQENVNEYSKKYGDTYNQEKNKPNNYKYNHTHHQNMESSNHINNSYHPYKQNDGGYKRKEYKSMYDERSGYSRGGNYNKRGNWRN